MGDIIKTVKGMNRDMTCRGFQYEEGKEYEELRQCTNCLFEYACSWKPAGDRPCCEHWRPEVKHEKE